MPSVQAAVSWMPEYKGLIMGWIVGMIGIAAALWNLITNTLINPEGLLPSGPASDKSFPIEMAEKVPGLLRTLFCIHLVMHIIAVIFVMKKPVPVVKATEALIPSNNESHVVQFIQKKDFIVCFINNALTVGTGVMLCGL